MNQRQKDLKAELKADRKVSKALESASSFNKSNEREEKCRAVIEEEGKAETIFALAKGK